jgi:uncharacterized protein (DUF952 family)
MDQMIYKICPREAWAEAQRTGTLPLSAADLRDGFVHLSAAHQVRATADKHFAGQSDLLLLAVKVSRLPPGALRWERSRGGEEFPHLYGPLQPAFVVSANAFPPPTPPG